MKINSYSVRMEKKATRIHWIYILMDATHCSYIFLLALLTWNWTTYSSPAEKFVSNCCVCSMSTAHSNFLVSNDFPFPCLFIRNLYFSFPMIYHYRYDCISIQQILTKIKINKFDQRVEQICTIFLISCVWKR